MVKQLKRKIHIQMLIYNQAYFILWYQSHLKFILASVCWAYGVTRYQAVIGPPRICYPMHELSLSV